MRESQGPRSEKVAAGISRERMLFSTLRIEARGMRKRSSCSAISWPATVNSQIKLCNVFVVRVMGGWCLRFLRTEVESLTNAPPSIFIPQIFQFNLWADFRSRLSQPC